MVDGFGDLNGSGNQQVWIHVHLHSQDQIGNYSTYYGEVRYYGNGWGTFTGSGLEYWSANFGGHVFSGSWSIPYERRFDSYTVLWAGYFNHGHNADGTRPAWGASATIDGQHSSIGDGTAYVTEPASPTIARASTPSISGGSGVTSGTAVTVNMNRASGSFTHNISWAFGSLSGQTGGFAASTGIADNVSWTPPASMLAQIPNSVSGSGTITVDTYSGGTYIGSKAIGFTLTAAASVVPTISSVTLADQNATVVSQVGAYVQGLSILRGTVNAAGVQGSTITTRTWSVSGITAASGADIVPTTTGTVAVGGAATDSRGRTATYAANITILPYAVPKYNSVLVRRATSAGVLADEGTYLRLDLNAEVQSIINSTQRNSLTIKVFTRLYGTTTWTARNVINHSSVSYNTNVLITGGAIFPVNQSFDVRIEINDKFNMAAAQTIVATAAVFMHWSSTGVGMGKYHEQGTLDVAGQIYQSANKVLDESRVASSADLIAGTDNTKYVSPLAFKTASEMASGLLEATYRGGKAKVKVNGVLSTESYLWMSPYQPQESRTVRLLRSGNTYLVTGQTNDGYESLQINTTRWRTYGDGTASYSFSRRPKTTRLPSGLVVLGGLLYGVNAAPTDASVIATLPEGHRPEHETIMAVEHGDISRAISIMPNGEIRVRGGSWANNQYLSLDGVAFWASGVPTWTNIGSGGSSWGTNFQSDAGWVSQFGAPGYWKDPYGFVWFRGLVQIKNAVSVDNTNIFVLPADHRSYREQHLRTAINDGFGSIGAQSTNGINWKVGNIGAAGAWIALNGVCVATQEAVDNNPWILPVSYANGWSMTNPATFPWGQYLRREDGLVHLMGLMSSGAVGTRGMSLKEEEYWPTSGRIILANVSNNARSRLDISGPNDLGGQYEPGSVVFTQGLNSWISMDGRYYVP